LSVKPGINFIVSYCIEMLFTKLKAFTEINATSQDTYFSDIWDFHALYSSPKNYYKCFIMFYH